MIRHRKTSSQAKSPSTPHKFSSPRRIEPSDHLTPSSNHLDRTQSSKKRVLSDSQSIKPFPNRPSPQSNNNHQHSANSTPTRAENDRKSFQGDHHRHRYMSYSASPTSVRPSPQSHKSAAQRGRPSPSQMVHSKSPRSSPRVPLPQPSSSERPPNAHPQQAPQLLNPTTQHLGAPINAHYSPHYGSSAQRVPTSKRKPPPPISSVDVQTPTRDHSPISNSRTPQTPSTRSQQSNNRSAEPSPSRSHRKLTKSRSPSPSPRSVGLAKIIGSVLTAPFRSSNSRRGSDASEIGLGMQDVARMEPNSFSLTTGNPPYPQQGNSERLPSMPNVSPRDRSSPGGHAPSNLTAAQRIIHETRSRETMAVVPESPERILRVVNGSATTSTQASTVSRKSLDGLFQPSSCDNTQALSITHNRSRASFPASSVYCSKCVNLESQLTDEVNRSRALERALEEQTNKLEQLRTWSTAKVTTLDHALKAQERMLQEVEKRLYENNEKPDIKSDYLIALQKDFIELNTRLAALEGKKTENDGDEFLARPGRSRDETLSNSQSSCETRDSPSTQPTSLGRITPSSGLSSLPEVHQFHGPAYACHDQEMSRPYSTSPLMMNKIESGKQTPEMMTPRKPITPWKPSSPATLASKLVPPTFGGSPRSPASNCLSAPATPNSRSPRPRYTSALGVKAPSPLSFNHTSHQKTQDRIGNNEAIKQIQSGAISPTPTGGPKSTSGTPITARYRKPFEVLNQTTGQGFTNSSVSSVNPPWKTNRFSSPASKYSNLREAAGSPTPNFHSKRISVINHQNQNQNLPNFSPSVDSVPPPTKPLALGIQKKPVVGDLIKMFDGPK